MNNTTKNYAVKKRPLDVAAGLRAQQAIKLRAQRLGWQQVAQQAGYASAGAAHNAVRRELARSISSDVDAWRQEELATLDELQRRVWPLAVPDDPKKAANLNAVYQLLQISKARREITGMDKPQQASQAPVAQVLVQQLNFDPSVI